MQLIEIDPKVARGVAALYLAGVTTLLLNTLFLVLLTNITTQAQVGLISILNVILVSASTIAVLALPLVGTAVAATPPAVARFLSPTNGTGSVHGRSVYLLSLGICAVISTAIVAVAAYAPVASLIAGPASAPAVFFACLDAMVYSFGQLGVYSMLGRDKATSAGKMIMVSSALRYVFASAFLLAGWGAVGVFAGFAVGDLYLAIAANLGAYIGLKNGEAVGSARSPILKYMVSVFFAALVGLAVTQSDKLLAFLKLGLPPLAVYNVATVGAAVASFIPSAVTNVIVPSLASPGGKDSGKMELLKAYTRHVSLSAIPIGFILAAVSPFLLRIFGDAYPVGAPVMALIAVSISFTAVSSVYSSSLLVEDRAHHFTLSYVLGLAGLVVVALLAVPTYGFFGIALGRSAMLFIIFASTAYFAWRNGRFVLDVGAYGKSVAASAFAGLIVYVILTIVSLLGASRPLVVGVAVLALPIGFAPYLVVMKALKAYTEGDMDFIESLIPGRLRFLSRLARRLL
jgi:O-antigen/teichoic acid export membrane protein